MELDPRTTAVITMELQRGVVGDLSFLPALPQAVARKGLLANVGRLLAGARAADAHVVHCTAGFRADGAGTPTNSPMMRAARDSDSSGGPGGRLVRGTQSAELMPALDVQPSDLIENRAHGMSPFGGTSLDATLRALGVRTIVATGVSVNIGIIGICIEAVNFGYEVVVPADAVAGIPSSYADAVLANSIAYLATVTTVDEIAWGRPAVP